MVAYSFKKRFITPIRIGLGLPARPEDADPDAATNLLPKRQTIRAIGRRRHARVGNILQLYTAMRTKQCALIGMGHCTSVHSVVIEVREHSMATSLDGVHVGGGKLRQFARADGFSSPEDMLSFWKKEHGIGRFEGVLIRWEPIR